MPHLTDAGIFVLKEPRPSIECINEHTLKGSYDAFLKIIILYVTEYVDMLLCSKNTLFFQILYIIVGPLCPASLKRIVFYKVPPSDKRSLL